MAIVEPDIETGSVGIPRGHEPRNPHAVERRDDVAGLLEDMELGPAQLEYVRLIRQSGDHLLVLINDIPDFSRL